MHRFLEQGFSILNCVYKDHVHIHETAAGHWDRIVYRNHVQCLLCSET